MCFSIIAVWSLRWRVPTVRVTSNFEEPRQAPPCMVSKQFARQPFMMLVLDRLELTLWIPACLRTCVSAFARQHSRATPLAITLILVRNMY